MHTVRFNRRRPGALAPAAVLLLALCLLAVGAQALTDSPALVVNEPGRYTLDHDLTSDAAVGVLINSSDVVFDGMGHSIEGTGNGTGVFASGTADPITGDAIANVTIRNLTVRHWSTGIFGGWLTGSVVEDVVAEQNGVGLGHGGSGGGWSTQGVVRDSVFRENTGAGIYLDYPADGIAIERCRATGNGDGLVTFDSGRFDSAANRIDGCDFSGNAGTGLSISEGHFSEVGNSTISGNGGDGVRIVKSYTTFSGNRIENNGGTGVNAGDRSSSSITGNWIEGNGVGVQTDTEFGFGIWNNVLNNTVNGYISTSAGGRLNVTRTAGPNIVGGPFIGGNFWAFPNGTGFSQTHPDTDGDGFCDEAYFLNEGTSDALPLALPNETPIGGDRGYFLVSTVPSGAAISLVDISGTAYPQGNTSAGPLNVTISLTATPMRSIVANLSGYRDAVFTITQFPGRGETVPVSLTLEPVGPQPYRPHTVPGRIQAEDYNLGGEGVAYHDTTPGNEGGAYRHDDVDIENANGITDVGWIRTGEYLVYTVNVSQAGAYRLNAHVASPNSGRTFTIAVDGENPLTYTVPNTGSFDAYATAAAPKICPTFAPSQTPVWPPAGDSCQEYWVTLAAGTHTLTLAFQGDGQNIDWFELTQMWPGPTPYTPLAIPGTIQAEDYDVGGEGVAYHDTTPVNEGGAYRNDGVDIESANGVTNVGWIRDGEWLVYTVNVTVSGTYNLTASVASPNSGRTITLLVAGEPAATIAVPNTGSFGAFRTVSVPVTLSAGTITLRLRFAGDGQNLDWIGFAASTPTPSPFVDVTIPGTLQAENYDWGGEGVAYHDTTPGNSGDVYRAGDVDLAAVAGGYAIVGIADGEYVTYTVNVPTAGSYLMTARVASPNGNRTIELSVDGKPSSFYAVPNTGSLTQFGSTIPPIVCWDPPVGFGSCDPVPVSLEAGTHTLKITFHGDGQSLDSIEFAPVSAPPTPPDGTPFTVLAIPGTIEAEDYNLGGEGVAYHDTTPGNEGGAFRDDGVDIETQGGITNVGWIRDGEWLAYTATIEPAETYALWISLASPNAGRMVVFSVDGEFRQTIMVPQTGSFERFATAMVAVNLPAGTHTLRLTFHGDGQNVDWIRFTKGPVTTTPMTLVTTPVPSGAGFVAVPTTAPYGSAVKFTVTPASGKSIASAWWSFDAPAHLNTWNSRAINPTFYYPSAGTFSPLVKITYTDGSSETVQRANYVRAT